MRPQPRRLFAGWQLRDTRGSLPHDALGTSGMNKPHRRRLVERKWSGGYGKATPWRSSPPTVSMTGAFRMGLIDAREEIHSYLDKAVRHALVGAPRRWRLNWRTVIVIGRPLPQAPRLDWRHTWSSRQGQGSGGKHRPSPDYAPFGYKLPWARDLLPLPSQQFEKMRSLDKPVLHESRDRAPTRPH